MLITVVAHSLREEWPGPRRGTARCRPRCGRARGRAWSTSGSGRCRAGRGPAGTAGPSPGRRGRPAVVHDRAVGEHDRGERAVSLHLRGTPAAAGGRAKAGAEMLAEREELEVPGRRSSPSAARTAAARRGCRPGSTRTRRSVAHRADLRARDRARQPARPPRRSDSRPRAPCRAARVRTGHRSTPARRRTRDESPSPSRRRGAGAELARSSGARREIPGAAPCSGEAATTMTAARGRRAPPGCAPGHREVVERRDEDVGDDLRDHSSRGGLAGGELEQPPRETG